MSSLHVTHDMSSQAFGQFMSGRVSRTHCKPLPLCCCSTLDIENFSWNNLTRPRFLNSMSQSCAAKEVILMTIRGFDFWRVAVKRYTNENNWFYGCCLCKNAVLEPTRVQAYNNLPISPSDCSITCSMPSSHTL